MKGGAHAWAVAGGLALTWLVPSSAAALSVSVGAPPLNDTIFVQASAGEANALTITKDATDFIVVENGQVGGNPIPVNPGGTGCPTPTPNSARCPAAGVSKLMIQLSDEDDSVTVSTATAAVIEGGVGDDTLTAGGAADTVRGEDGLDVVSGGAGDDLLYGDGPSELDPGSGADQVAGGPGNDRLNGGRGVDVLWGEAGTDTLRGGSQADRLSGGDDGDVVSGEAGDDAMLGGPGHDTVGVPGTIAVGATLLPAEPGNDTLVGGPGDDSLDPGSGGRSDRDTLVGDEGDDTVAYGLRTATVRTAKNGVADDGQAGEGDSIGSDIERIVGGSGPDHLSGGPGVDAIIGGPGDDTLAGLGGDDQVAGDGGLSAGTDSIDGGPGADRLDGEGGTDTLTGGAGEDVVEGGTGGDTLSGGPDPDRLAGGLGRDAVAYGPQWDTTVSLQRGLGTTPQNGDSDRITEIEDVNGGTGRDTFTGSRARNVLTGAGGEDYVDGARGVDDLDGGASADVVAARDGARDRPVSCGRGHDLAIVDRRDRVQRRGRNACEQVDDGSRTRPRPGWAYVHPRRCAAPREEIGLELPAMNRSVPLRYSILLRTGYRRRSAPGLDTSACTLRMKATTGRGRTASADISGGPVTVAQRGRGNVTTTLTVRRPTCATAAQRRGGRRGRSRARVRTRGGRRGRWKVKGRYSIGGSYGTDWTTFEACGSTTTVVRRGRVRVFDRVERRTIIVRAGQSYVARATREARG